ncbi:hypothetical protein GGI42DRAFT_316707 [Trichoderma sp. SZMC 28013]
MRLASWLGLSLAVRDGFPLRDGYRCQYNKYENCLSCPLMNHGGAAAPPMGIMGMVQSQTPFASEEDNCLVSTYGGMTRGRESLAG